MKQSPSTQVCHSGSPWNVLLWATLMVATTTASSICLKHLDLAASLRLLLVLLPLGPTLFYIVACVRTIRQSSDELIRRIHLEACAFCLPSFVLFAMVVSLLLRGGFVSAFRWEWETIALTLAGLYGLGYLLARRQYR